MTLPKQITEELQRTPRGHTGEIQAIEGDVRVAVNLADWDRLGFLLNRLEFTNSRGGPLSFDPVELEAQVTYLGERLGVIESEGKRGRTILRSAPPRVEGNMISFYEMVLDPAEGLSLMRYDHDRKLGKRLPVAAPVTRATLERLLTDLLRLVQEN